MVGYFLSKAIEAIYSDDNETFKSILTKLPHDLQEEVAYLAHKYEATSQAIHNTLKEHLDCDIPEEKQLTIDQMAEILKQLEAEEPDLEVEDNSSHQQPLKAT